MSCTPDLHQARLIKSAALHYMHAEAREEGDVAVFCEAVLADGRAVIEIEVVTNGAELRAVLGY